jgi:mandelamide amidase
LFECKRELDRYLEGEELSQRFADIVAEVASPDVKPALASLLDPATAIPEQVFREAIQTHRPKLIELYRSYFAAHNVDAIVFPTTPLPAPRIGEDETVMLNGRAVPTFLTVIRNTDPGSNAGIPGLSVPVGLTSVGLPVGLEFDAAAGRDRDLLAVALSLETVFPAP